MGTALRRKEQYDEAMTAFRKALSFESNDRPGNTWNSLGLLYRDKAEFDLAIESFNKALSLPKSITEATVWHNMGLTLKNKGDNHGAISAYTKSLELGDTYLRPKTLNSLGNAYLAIKDYTKAIQAYEEAIACPGADNSVMVWANLALAFEKDNKLEQARDAFLRALSLPDPSQRQHKRAQLGLDSLDGKLKTEALGPNDRTLLEQSEPLASDSEPEKRLITKITEAGGTKYDQYLKGSNSDIQDSLVILRGWSSAMPLLEGSKRNWRGGGYFIKWRGFGLVIDPGFDFLRNMHDAKIHAREIHAVAISHNHPDHNYDLKAIDDLRYEIYKRRTNTPPNDIKPYVLLWDEDTYKSFVSPSQTPEHHSIPIVFTSGYSHSTDLTTHESKLPFRIKAFKVNHGRDVIGAMGLLIDCLREDSTTALRLGYTGDTEYFAGLNRELENCDVLIAHISQPDLSEFADNWKYKTLHLGYRGVIELIKNCKPKLTLIGEFWAGFCDLRIDLIKGIRIQTGNQAVLPAGLGLNLNLVDNSVLCTSCHQATPFDKIRVTPPVSDFGNLGYLCPHCVLH